MSIAHKNILMIVAPENFKDEEYFIPKQILKENKANIQTASIRETATSVNGKTIKIDLMLDEANANNYNAIIFIGGSGAKIYFENTNVFALAKNALLGNKIIAAICIASSILANSGILKNKKATCFPSEKDNLVKKGAIYTGKNVEIDGKIITANGPQSAEEFGNAIVRALS